MRWLAVKLVNFVIVLVIVTFIVAAIFAGPLTERQKQALRQEIQQEVIAQLRLPGGQELKKEIIKEYMEYAKSHGLPINNETLDKDALRWYIDQLTQEEIHNRGLDKPWYIIATRYTKTMLTFEPVNSSATLETRGFFFYKQGDKNAYHIILERVPFSVLLFTTSSTIVILLATPLALYAARRPGGILDNTIVGWSVFSVSMPWWWLAMVFIFFFTQRYHIFPKVTENFNPHDIGNLLSKAALPVLTVTVLSVGDTAYRMRNILLDVFNEDFVMVARAKGLPEPTVLRKHVLRAAAPPIVTIVLFSIVLSVFAGAIITELIFEWPGLGKLYWDAISANDVAVLTVLTYVTTLLYLVTRLVLDILYTLLDPRIKRA
ncbi:MAG: ABC transporter permease [Desulfurococcales archaeon]|nr:ABC transporter permease [Desulfurococcales archaeon]